MRNERKKYKYSLVLHFRLFFILLSYFMVCFVVKGILEIVLDHYGYHDDDDDDDDDGGGDNVDFDYENDNYGLECKGTCNICSNSRLKSLKALHFIKGSKGEDVDVFILGACVSCDVFLSFFSLLLWL